VPGAPDDGELLECRAVKELGQRAVDKEINLEKLSLRFTGMSSPFV